MEPYNPAAGTTAGSAASPLPPPALLAPTVLVDSLTGAVLPATSEADPEATGAAPDAVPAANPTPTDAVAAAFQAAPALDGAAPPIQASDRGWSLAAVPAAAASLSPWQPAASAEADPAFLTLAGRRYAVADLPPDARELFDGLRLADLLLAQKGETCQLLRWGLNALADQLRQGLKAVEPLPQLAAGLDPSPPAGQGIA